MRKTLLKTFTFLFLLISMIAISKVNTYAASSKNLDKLPNKKVIIEYSNDKTEIFIKDKNNKLLFKMKATSDKVYATTELNLRKRPTTKSAVRYTVNTNTKLKRLGHSDFGWDLIERNGKKVFAWNKYLSKKKVKVEEIEVEEKSAEYSASYFKQMGVIYWGGYRWTWYSQNVLPGGGLKIPGRHVDGNGYVCDENDYLCLASNDLSKGTVVSTPFGKSGKVYDCGCASGTLDVYTAW